MTVHPGVATILRDIIGLDGIDEENPLHQQLADAITNAGPGASFGARVVALRYVFNWQLLDAGQVFAKAKADYERFIDTETVKLRGTAAAKGEKTTRAEAEQIARASDRAYELHLAYLVAEQKERSFRNFLNTLESALDNHRTDRADQRAADKASAQGYGGGA